MPHRRSIPAALIAAPLVILAAAGGAWPQTNPCLDRTVAVSVTTEDGRLVKGLVAANFRATSHGQPVRIVSAAYETGPRRIVLAFDTSGSILANKAQMSLSLKVAEDLAATAPAQCSIAFLTFASRVGDRVAFDQGRQAVLNEIDKLQNAEWPTKGPERRTALVDALLEGLSLLRPADLGDALYVISDGDENASRARPNDLRRALAASQARLFGFFTLYPGLGPRIPEEPVGAAELKGVAEASGGEIIFWSAAGIRSELLNPDYVLPQAATDPRVRFASRGLVGEISEFYRLELRLPQAPKKPTDWRLDVVDQTGKVSKDLKLLYPRKLAACQP